MNENSNLSILTIKNPGLTIFEAENADTTHYNRSSNFNSDIIERPDASNGKFLAAASESKRGYFSFTLCLEFNSEIIMSASYSQQLGLENNDLDMRSSYSYLIDENKTVGLSQNYILKARKDITKWQTITYDKFTLPKGNHSFRVSPLKYTGLGNPNIDYISFNVTEIGEIEFDEIEVPENDFHTPIQYSYIRDDARNVRKYAKGVSEQSKPNPINLDFSSESISESNNFSIEYSEFSDFKNSVIVNNLNEKILPLFNLKLGQDLFWRVRNAENPVVHHLNVSNLTPRNLSIEGVTNVRDIGGYKSSLVEDGVIRQGLYFRGARLDSITENGKKELLRLGVRVEIDLRDDYMCNGPYVDGIKYHAFSIPSETEPIRFEQFAREYFNVFSLIEKADSKPVYLHCSVGADRTGIATFILLVVCGVSFEDTARDYLFTNFSTCGERYLESEFLKWWKKLDLFQGETKADKAKNWLISKGLKGEQVEHIRKIFVEGYI